MVGMFAVEQAPSSKLSAVLRAIKAPTSASSRPSTSLFAPHS